MHRPPRTARFDQRPRGQQRFPHVSPAPARGPQPDGQFGSGHHLGMHADDIRTDHGRVNVLPLPSQPTAREPPPRDFLPSHPHANDARPKCGQSMSGIAATPHPIPENDDEPRAPTRQKILGDPERQIRPADRPWSTFALLEAGSVQDLSRGVKSDESVPILRRWAVLMDDRHSSMQDPALLHAGVPADRPQCWPIRR